MADGDENAVYRHQSLLTGHSVFERDTGHFVFPVDLGDYRVPADLDLWVVDGSTRHDLRSPELVSAVNDRHFGGELRQEQSLFHGCVAASDHHQLLVTEEEAVTCGASGHSSACQLLLSWHAQPLSGGSRGDDHRVGCVFIGTHLQLEGPFREVDLCHIDLTHPRAEPLGLLPEVIHQLRAHDPIGESRVVLHVCRDHELATGGDSFEDERFEVRSRRIQRCRQACWARANDDQFLMCHLFVSS